LGLTEVTCLRGSIQSNAVLPPEEQLHYFWQGLVVRVFPRLQLPKMYM
jgi:hypothetical protein